MDSQFNSQVAAHSQNVQSTTQTQLRTFWGQQLSEIKGGCDFKSQVLPLARIKKIMKLDEDVKMISAEAPVLFSKALEIFICELSLRAWAHTEENKRRTLQKNDIAMAISRCDTFDFLIDIVPRDDIKTKRPEEEIHPQAQGVPGMVPPEQLYYYQLAQQGMDPNQPFPYQQQPLQYQQLMQQQQMDPNAQHMQQQMGQGGFAPQQMQQFQQSQQMQGYQNQYL